MATLLAAERAYEPVAPQRVAFIGLGVMGQPKMVRFDNL